MPRKPKFVYGSTREELQETYVGNQTLQEEAGKVPKAFYDRPMIHPKEDAFEVMTSPPKKRGRPKKNPVALTVAPKVVISPSEGQLTLPGIPAPVPTRKVLPKSTTVVPGVTQDMLEAAIKRVLKELFLKALQ
jgi:hypothetical protein